MTTNPFLTADWAQLDELPPAERVKRATEQQEVANDIKKRLSQVSTEAIKEMADSGMTRAEIGAEIGVSVQRIGQLLGADSRPDGIDMTQLRLVAKMLSEYVTLTEAERKQVEAARRVLSRSGRVSTFEARGTAARLSHVGHRPLENDLAELPAGLRQQYLVALAHADDARRT
jgi:hypothetical protein